MSLNTTLLAGFFFTTLSIFAQRSASRPVATMEICSVKLSIGMLKEKVVTLTAESCHVDKVGLDKSDEWFVTEKTAERKPVAVLNFELGRLSRVSQSRLPDGGTSEYGAAGLARSLVLVLNSQTDGRDTSAIIRSVVTQDKNYTFYTLVMFLPNGHQVELRLMVNGQTGKTEMLDLDEALMK
jgi:hypothetical protein